MVPNNEQWTKQVPVNCQNSPCGQQSSFDSHLPLQPWVMPLCPPATMALFSTLGSEHTRLLPSQDLHMSCLSCLWWPPPRRLGQDSFWYMLITPWTISFLEQSYNSYTFVWSHDSCQPPTWILSASHDPTHKKESVHICRWTKSLIFPRTLSVPFPHHIYSPAKVLASSFSSCA